MSELTMTDVETRRSGFATVKYYAILAYGAVGTVAAVGLMVAGSVLVGLAIPVLLAGLGIVDVEPEMTTGPLVISGLIVGLAGGFFLGVASESPLGRGRRLQGFKIWEVGIGRTLAVLATGLAFLTVYRLVLRWVGEVPIPLLKGIETLRAVGSAAILAMPLIGVPISLLVRAAPTRREWVRRLDEPALYLVWVIAALLTLV